MSQLRGWRPQTPVNQRMDLAFRVFNNRDTVKGQDHSGTTAKVVIGGGSPNPCNHLRATISTDARGGDGVQEAWIRATVLPGKGRSVLSAAKRAPGRTNAPCVGKVHQDPAQYTNDRMMTKTRPPCTRAKLNFGDSVLD